MQQRKNNLEKKTQSVAVPIDEKPLEDENFLLKALLQNFNIYCGRSDFMGMTASISGQMD